MIPPTRQRSMDDRCRASRNALVSYIAAVVGRPPASLRSRLQRDLAALRQGLRGRGQLQPRVRDLRVPLRTNRSVPPCMQKKNVPMQGASDGCHTCRLHGRPHADTHCMPGRPHALATCPSHVAALMLCYSNCCTGTPMRRTFLVIQPRNHPPPTPPPRTRRALVACEVHALVVPLPELLGG